MKRIGLLTMLCLFYASAFSQVVGNGVTITNFDIEGDELAFSPTTVGTTATFDLLVTNNVGVAQDIVFSGVDGPFGLDSTSITLNPNASEVITLSFSPTEVGNFSAQLIFSGSIFGSGELFISGEGTQIDITVDNGFVQFENTAIGSSSTAELTISNIGSGTMLISSFEFSDDQFSVEEEDLSIAEGDSYTITITFTPTIAGGTNETLTIHSNDPDEAEYVIDLIATGISEVEGELCGTWSLMNSPYTLTNNVTIPDDCSLTIEAGVVINGNNYDIIAEGPVHSLGTEDQRVTWNEVDLDMTLDGGESCSLIYSDMEGININAEGTEAPFEHNWNYPGNEDWYYGGTANITNDNSRLRSGYWGCCSWHNSYTYSPERNFNGQLGQVSYDLEINDYDNSGNGSESIKFQINIDGQGWEDIDTYYYMGDQPNTTYSFNLDSLYSESKVQFRFHQYFYYGFYTYLDNFSMNVGQEERVEVNFNGLTSSKDFIMDGERCDVSSNEMRTYYVDWDQEFSTYAISNWIIEGHGDKNEGAYFLGDYNE